MKKGVDYQPLFLFIIYLLPAFIIDNFLSLTIECW